MTDPSTESPPREAPPIDSARRYPCRREHLDGQRPAQPEHARARGRAGRRRGRLAHGRGPAARATAGPTPCPWRTLTGLDCPFCGATRAAASLAHGDVVGALDHNALFVLVILPLAVAGLGDLGRALVARAARTR